VHFVIIKDGILTPRIQNSWLRIASNCEFAHRNVPVGDFFEVAIIFVERLLLALTAPCRIVIRAATERCRLFHRVYPSVFHVDDAICDVQNSWIVSHH
jgi:hypothetical protein